MASSNENDRKKPRRKAGTSAPGNAKSASRASKASKEALNEKRLEPSRTWTGDRLNIVIREGPDGEPIVDTHLIDSRQLADPRPTRQRLFSERSLAAALRAQRMVIAAKVVRDHGSIEQLREAVTRIATALEQLIDLVLVTCADVSARD